MKPIIAFSASWYKGEQKQNEVSNNKSWQQNESQQCASMQLSKHIIDLRKKKKKKREVNATSDQEKTS